MLYQPSHLSSSRILLKLNMSNNSKKSPSPQKMSICCQKILSNNIFYQNNFSSVRTGNHKGFSFGNPTLHSSSSVCSIQGISGMTPSSHATPTLALRQPQRDDPRATCHDTVKSREAISVNELHNGSLCNNSLAISTTKSVRGWGGVYQGRYLQNQLRSLTF